MKLHERILAWKAQLEAEKASLLQLQTTGEFTEEEEGRLLYIESMLEQVDNNQYSWWW